MPCHLRACLTWNFCSCSSFGDIHPDSSCCSPNLGVMLMDPMFWRASGFFYLLVHAGDAIVEIMTATGLTTALLHPKTFKERRDAWAEGQAPHS